MTRVRPAELTPRSMLTTRRAFVRRFAERSSLAGRSLASRLELTKRKALGRTLGLKELGP